MSQDEGRPGGQGERGHSIAPAVPAPPSPETTRTKWYTLSLGRKHSLCYRSGEGADEFFIGRGLRKIDSTYPLNQEGWLQAWIAFQQLEPTVAADYAETARRRLAAEQFSRLPPGLAFLRGCTFLGGYGTSLAPGTPVEILCEEESFTIMVDRVPQHRVPYAEVREVEISGRGQMSKGGGFIGGGFGVTGALEGMAIAALLNSLTTRTYMETVLRLNCDSQELFFHSATLTPALMRIQLSAPIARTAGAKANRLVSEPAAEGSPTTVDRLERLAAMLHDGLLTREEFDTAKRSILGLSGECGKELAPE